MGWDAEHITRFPDNPWGHSAIAFLQQFGLRTNHIDLGGDRLGLYYLETGALGRASQVVYDRAFSAFSTLKPEAFDWDKILDGADWFHFTGISPAISQSATDACFQALDAANAKGVPVSFDVNYRKNLWQFGKKPHDVIPALAAQSDVLFCSKGDMRDLFSLSGPPEEKYVDVCKRALDKFPRVRKLVNSKRESFSASDNTISGVLFNGQELVNSRKHRLFPIVDRIGGGDAFCAGLIHGLVAYGNDADAIECAVASSAIKHSIEGDFNRATLAEIETLMRGDSSGKLSR
jgi:2-dehydro-3-deoxygluconokinase